MFFSSERIFLTLAVRMLVSYAILLEDFAADVEGKVFAVDDAAHEAQILRKKLPGVVQDKDALDVELDTGLELGLVEIERRLGGNEEERSVFETSFSFGVNPEEWILGVAGDRLVQLLVSLIGNLVLGPAPEGTRRIHLFGGARLDGFLFFCVPFALVVGEEDGKGDVVGVLLDDFLQAPAVGVLLAFLIEVEKHRSAGDRPLRGLDVESCLTIADPTPGLLFAGFARQDFNAVGNHECAVEANAKLANQI